MRGFELQVIKIAERLQAAGLFKPELDLLKSDHQFLADLFSRRLSERGWQEALRRLTELTRLKTIVLVDEFDTPMWHALEYGSGYNLRAFITVSSLIDPNGCEIVE